MPATVATSQETGGRFHAKLICESLGFRLEAFPLSRDHHKVSTFRGEALSDSQADANARSGDDSDFVS